MMKSYESRWNILDEGKNTKRLEGNKTSSRLGIVSFASLLHKMQQFL